MSVIKRGYKMNIDEIKCPYDKCPFVLTKECEVPPCNECYLKRLR